MTYDTQIIRYTINKQVVIAVTHPKSISAYLNDLYVRILTLLKYDLYSSNLDTYYKSVITNTQHNISKYWGAFLWKNDPPPHTHTHT